MNPLVSEQKNDYSWTMLRRGRRLLTPKLDDVVATSRWSADRGWMKRLARQLLLLACDANNYRISHRFGLSDKRAPACFAKGEPN